MRVVGLFIALLVSLSTAPVTFGATFYWDTDTSTVGNATDGTGLGGTGTWDIATSNWWDLTSLVTWPNTSADIAIFTGPYVAGAPTLNTVTLSGAITANQVSFLRSGYTLTGGTSLTLAGAGAGLHANLGESATIASLIAGSDGLTKTGGGAIRLSNSGNTYTGTTTISNGILIITGQGGLGLDSSAVVVTEGNPVAGNTQFVGYQGGSLVLDGSTAGFSFTRDLNLQGSGPIGGRGAALLSIGNNTLSGVVDMAAGATARNTRIISNNGLLTLSGTIDVSGTAGTTINTLGGTNTAGAGGSFALTGALTGTGTLEKIGAGTLFLTPSTTSGFSGVLRVSGSATGGQSSARITANNVLGSRTSGTTGAVLDMNGGVLEVRMDTPLVQATGGSNANVYGRASSTLFLDHALGGSAINGTAAFGNLSYEDNITLTFNSRNGYGMSFTTAPVNGGDNTSTLTNNMGGTLSFTGDFWSNANNTGNRTMTVGGNGNTVINGNVVASAAAYNHNLTKTGSGSLTITGTGSTLDGNLNAQGGAVVITDFRSLNMHTAGSNTGQINIGTTTTAGALVIGTGTTPTAAGLTTNQVVNLAGTTGDASIYANQTGSNPVIFNSAFTATGAGDKELYLGGSNTLDNTINGAIVDNGGTNNTELWKLGTGTWVLAGTNTYTLRTVLIDGTLKLKANAATSTIITDTSEILFGTSNGFAGATLEFVGQDGVNNVETLGLLNVDDGAVTIKLSPGVGGTASLVFSSLATPQGDTAINIVGSDGVTNTVSFTTPGTTGLASGPRVFFNGSDFAYNAAGTLRAPVYGTDADFAAPTSTALTSTQSNWVTGSFSNGAVTIDTLKISGGSTLTLTGDLIVRTGGSNTGGTILAVDGSSVITGFGIGGNGTEVLSFRVDDAADVLTVESDLLSTITGGISKSGAGTLVLAGTNAQTGFTAINEGTLRLGTGATLSGSGTATQIIIRTLGTFDLNGVSTGAAIDDFTNAGLVINTSATAATLTVGNNNGGGTSFGIIDESNGTISVTKAGTGAQSWLGSSTYTGVTTIGSTGLVTVDTLADGGTASGIGASSSAASNLVFNGSTGGLVYAGSIRNGNLTLGSRSASTDRLFTLSGTGATLSSTASNNNAIVWSNTGAIVHGVVGPQTLVFAGTSAGDNTFNPQLTDSGSGSDITSVTKREAGQWNLGNSGNSYTGFTTVENGVLALNDNGALPANSPLALTPTSTTSEAVLQMSGTFDRNLSASPAAGTGTITWGFSATIPNTDGGAGFAAHTTALTVAIGGIGSPTALTWGSGGFVGTGGAQNLVLGSTSALSYVDFRNDIDLGASQRTVNVLDNTNTGADYAILSGDLDGVGGGSLRKIGAGILKLTGANTYTGVTDINAGTLVVSSLGSSTGGGSSSVGAGGVTMDNTNAITIGNASTSNAILQYVGPGETSDRKIRINATTGSSAGAQIHADGAGPLILTNVANDMVSDAGSKNLWLRGTNAAGNMITSVLANNGGPLNVLVDGSATWILTGANTYTGATTVSGGALGIGHDSALGGTGTLTLGGTTGGAVFAYGADRTIANPVTEVNSTSAITAFIGDYSLTFNGAWDNPTTTASGRYTRNNLVSGKTLTINGAYTFSGVTTGTNWNFDGTGDTIINGLISNTAGTMGITYAGTGSLTLGGANTYNGDTRVSNGILKLGANDVIPSGAGKGNVALNPAAGVTATLDLNGRTETINGLTATTDGTAVIDNTSATAASLTFGDNDAAVNFGAGLGAYTITDSGAGALSLVKTGAGTATIAPGVTLTYQGGTSSTGGTFTINSAVNGTTGLSATGSSTLSLAGGITSPGAITSVTVDGGSTLSLVDGAGSAITGLTALSLGAGSGTATLNLNVGTGATDTLTLLTGSSATLANTITFNLTDAGLSASTTYTLLTITDGGISAFGIGNMIQGIMPGGFSSMTWTVTDTLVQLTTGTLLGGDLYWRGLTDTTWNANVNNWSTDKAGTTPATTIPGQGNDVIFAYDGASGALTTTLEQNFKINSLTFESGTTTPSSVTINPGTVSSNRIEIAPAASADGIAITAGGPPAVTISAPVKLGATQTWNVADSGSTLTLSGALQGEADVTKSGSGRVVLATAADAAFNPGATSDFTVSAGNLEIQNTGSLGSTANSNLASLNLTGGGFYYNNATAGTVANSITLSGGTLSGGGANHTYSGTVNVSGNSFINLADSNGPATNTVRNITLSGAVSGSNSLTIDSNNTVSGGNQIGGTLTINNAAGTWTGDLLFNEGTVTIAAAASATVLPDDVTFNSFGRLILQGVDGQTINRSGTLNYAAGAVGEFQVDNTTGTQATDFTVNQNGAVALGSGGTGASMRVALVDTLAKLNLAGGVTLGGNSSISVSNNAARLLTISGVIGDGGSGYGLAINDDAGGWAQTNGIVRLTGANTFTGNVSLGGGILEFDTVTNISGGNSSLGNGTAITSTADATLRFIGTTAQSTDRPVTASAGVLTLSANGDEAADTITYNGAISTGGNNFTLTGATGREGIITGGITQTGDAADATISGGTWTHTTGTSRVADTLNVTGTGTILNLTSGLFQVRNDFTVTANAVLNLNATGVLSYDIATLSADSTLRATGGGTINLGADNAVVVTQFDGLRIGRDAPGTGTLNMGAFDQSVAEFILGYRNLDWDGVVTGTGGILTVASGGNIDLFEGSISANLASSGSTTLDKFGLETVTLSGDNSGLASTGATVIDEGTLVLDYTTSNTTKIRAASQLNMAGSNLVLNGNASAATSQSVASFTLGSGGNSVITLNPGSGQDLVLNLNAITRAVNSQDGTVRFNLPSGTQSATNGITTDTLNTIGTGANAILGGWATVDDGSGVFFARNVPNAANGNIGAATTTLQDAVGSWLAGENISDSTGFTGTLACAYINSLRFNAAAGSSLMLAQGGLLGIQSGGILVTDQVSDGPGIFNGTLSSGAIASNVPELIITQDSAQTFTITSDVRVNHNVIKSGSGTMLLGGNNVYTGVTEIQNGILQVSGGNAIGDTSLVTLAANRNSTLELLSDETIGRLAGGQRADAADLGTVALGTHTLTINETAASTYNGKFTGSGSVVKVGSSALTLTGDDSTGQFTGNFAVNQGLVVLSSTGTPFQGVSGITLTGPTSSMRLDNDQTTAVASRIKDTATITLNSTAGTTADALGLFMRRTASNTTGTETVGQLILNSGHNTVAADGTATDRIGRLNFSNATPLVRNNFSTLFVVARNMNATSGQRGRISFSADPGGAIGGGGAAGTTTINVFPYMVGEAATGAPSGAANFGNSFVRYESGTTDLRALDPTTEYINDSTAITGALTDNIRYTATAAITSTPTAINSLVLDSGTAIALSGSASSMEITSGAILAAGAAAHSISGITGITTGVGNPYYFYVTNPSGSLTLASTTLSSAQTLVKSGAGTLILGATNSVTGVYLNQGTLEIGDLDHIGGGTGALVFAGGTLRLGAGFTDDISTRTISFLLGGGTLDTNGIDPTLAGSLGSGGGGFTKTGAGNLTLNAAATYTGATTLATGTLTIGASNALGVGGDLTLAGGTTLALGTNSLTHGLVITSGASPAITGTGTITASTGFYLNHTGDTSIDALLAGAGGLLKAQTNIVTLTGANTYTGTTEIQAGTLSINSVANLGSASALGAPITAEDGIIRMGLTTAATTLNYTGSGHTSNRTIAMQGTTGGVTLDADGTGALVLGGVHGEMAGAKTLTLQGSSGAAIINSLGLIEDCAATLALTKTEANTWALTGANTYSGATAVNAGILRISNNSALGSTAAGTSVATGGTLQLDGGITVTGEALSLTASATGEAILDSLTGSNTWTGNLTVNTGTDASNRVRLLSETGSDLLVSGAVNLSAGTSDFVIGGDGDGEISGVITGSQRLFKSGVGAGTWTLSADNSATFTGKAVVSNGALQISAENNLGATPGAYVADQLRLGGGSTTGTLITTADMSLSANRGVSLGAGGGAFNTATGTTLTVNSIIEDGGSGYALTKSGDGTVALANDNTYTGTTTVSGGTLQLGSGGTSGSLATGSSISVGAGAVFAVNQTDLVTQGTEFSGAAITGAGGFSQLGSGRTVLNVSNTYGGPTTVSAGTLQVGDGTSGDLAGSGAVTVVKTGSTIGSDAPVLSGGGSIAGATVIGDAGNNANRGVIAPSITATSTTSNRTLTFTASGTALTVAGGSQMELSITNPTSAADAGVLAALTGGTYGTASAYITANSPSWTTGGPATVSDYDFINLTAGALSLGTRNGGFGSGTVAVVDNGYLVGAQLGDVFNLLDWVGAFAGSFTATTSGNFTQGGAWDDMDLPTLSGVLYWDTSAVASHGVLVVVPEPGRAVLLLFGLATLFLRRRRNWE